MAQAKAGLCSMQSKAVNDDDDDRSEQSMLYNETSFIMAESVPFWCDLMEFDFGGVFE